MSSKIEWTDETWNPTRGCRRVSPGCENCYAERLAIRMAYSGGPYEGLVKSTPNGPRWTGKGRFSPEALTIPLRRRAPTIFFVDSMSDLFYGEFRPYLAAIFGVMAAAKQHTLQILTKRPQEALDWFNRLGPEDDFVAAACRYLDEVGYERGCGSAFDPDEWPLPNVWLGVSAESQEYADERIPVLLRCPAAKRFVSYEPALGPLAIRDYLPGDAMARAFEHHHRTGHDCSGYADQAHCEECRIGFGPDDPAIDWVICGAESGPGARPMETDWARSIRDQCTDAEVPFMLKQFADKGKKVSLPVLDGCQWTQIPEGKHGA